ncbi:hypothetical protein KVR01_003904 [Diaporthe batatas]|uniref:uncharacterized protein n=1 Tax=Diaporthe batatas TaxID=748121 RepID=UPI001D045229|nr:uncharacterized protein KVR01_003904 [Diaporthe batatas]KAG8168215.1 hypothetical protein KVR01_003904 [Diaporthe batatas]
MTTPTPYNVFTGIYRVKGDDEFGMSREECQKLIDELPTYLSPQEIEEWDRETDPDMLDLSLDLEGLVQDKTGAVLRKPDHASCAYLSRLVGDTSPPQRVTQRWLKLAEYLGMPNNAEDDSDYSLCASALHLALYSQEIEIGSEAYKKLFKEQVINALAGFLSNRSCGRPGKKALPDLLRQVEEIWYQGHREDLYLVTETGQWQRPQSLAGATYEIVPSTFEFLMVNHILTGFGRSNY